MSITTAAVLTSASKAGRTVSLVLDAWAGATSTFVYDSSAAVSNGYVARIDPDGTYTPLNGGVGTPLGPNPAFSGNATISGTLGITPSSGSQTALTISAPGAGSVDAVDIYVGATKKIWVDNTGQLNASAASISSLTITTALTLPAPLSIAQGGTGTNSPAFSNGSNVSITGSFPNYTVGVVPSPSFTSLTLAGLVTFPTSGTASSGTPDFGSLGGNSWGYSLWDSTNGTVAHNWQLTVPTGAAGNLRFILDGVLRFTIPTQGGAIFKSATGTTIGTVVNDGSSTWSGGAAFSGAVSATALTLSTTPLAVTSGGTGTATPSLVGTSGVLTITGSFPNQTLNLAHGDYADIVNTQTIAGAKTFSSAVTAKGLTLQDATDATKQASFVMSSIATATTRSYTLPNVSGTVVTTGDSGSVTNTMLAGSIAITKLLASTISGVSLGNTLFNLSFGTYLTGTSYNGSAAVTIGTNAVSTNTASTLVARDGSGGFSMGALNATGTLTVTNAQIKATDTTAGANGFRTSNSFTGGADFSIAAGVSGFSPHTLVFYDNTASALMATLGDNTTSGDLTLLKSGASFKTGSSVYGSTTATIAGTLSINSLTNIGPGGDLQLRRSTDTGYMMWGTNTYHGMYWNSSTMMFTLDGAGSATMPVSFGPATSSGTVQATQFVATSGAVLLSYSGAAAGTGFYHDASNAAIRSAGSLYLQGANGSGSLSIAQVANITASGTISTTALNAATITASSTFTDGGTAYSTYFGSARKMVFGTTNANGMVLTYGGAAGIGTGGMSLGTTSSTIAGITGNAFGVTGDGNGIGSIINHDGDQMAVLGNLTLTGALIVNGSNSGVNFGNGTTVYRMASDGRLKLVSQSGTVDIAANVSLSSGGSLTTGSSTYGATSATINGALTVAGITSNNDIQTNRGNTTGVIFLGNTYQRYVYFDGANYQMPLARLQSITGIDIASNGTLTTGSSIYGPTSAFINGTIRSSQGAGSTGFVSGSNNAQSDRAFVLGNTVASYGWTYFGAYGGTSVAGISGNVFKVTIGNSGFTSVTDLMTLDNGGNMGIAGTYYAVSHSSHKIGIRPIEFDPLDVIRRTTVRHFNYKHDPIDQEERLGLIADESPAEMMGPTQDRHDFMRTIAVLVAANQALLAKHEALEARVKDLETRCAS